jgi:hypothetical protein
MEKIYSCLIVMVLTAMIPVSVNAQKSQNPINQITSTDLESYVSFLASPLLKGRMNGEEGLEIAGQFIASQAKLSGLKPANGNSYFQPYTVMKKAIDPDKTMIQVIADTQDTVTINDPFFQLIPMEPTDLSIEGEVLFAGYGIRADKYNYNDFDNIQTDGKILLVMDRSPMSEDGKEVLFDEPEFSPGMSFQTKLNTLIFSRAKAILFVCDPKSGFKSLEESNPGLSEYVNSKVTLKGEKEENINQFISAMPKLIYINRSVADALLKGSGHSLEELQNTIDSTLKPHSFVISDKLLKLTEVTLSGETTLNNVAGYIEGSDPVLKNEVVVFSGHYDHIGASGGMVNPGADDDASGCAALLSIANAFQSLEKKPLRSVLFLWVSGEEIGLCGSKSYVDNPLFPIEKTVADINMDMIGRVKEVADSTDENPMTDPNTVFVITDSQSKDLQSIADEIDKKNPIDFDYSLSGRDHPLQLFARSDHYNFVEKDIPVLCFTTGLHTDYHTPGDVVEKIDFKKMEMITRTMYEIGLTVANRKKRLVVDNPFSSWGKSK